MHEKGKRFKNIRPVRRIVFEPLLKDETYFPTSYAHDLQWFIFGKHTQMQTAKGEDDSMKTTHLEEKI